MGDKQRRPGVVNCECAAGMCRSPPLPSAPMKICIVSDSHDHDRAREEMR
jgi:hypothetical protein